MFQSIWQDIKSQFSGGSMIIRIILVCVAVFIASETVHLICWIGDREALYYSFVHWLSLPLSFHTLIRQPWSVFTFMFMHGDVGHIFGNMLFLYWFGQVYYLYMYNKRALAIFFFGSLFGSALALTLAHIVPPMRHDLGNYMLGASAGVQAIMFAATAINPEHRVRVFLIGEVPIKYVAVGLALMDYLALTYGNAEGMIAHIGGAVFGYLYIKSLQAGTDWFKPLDRMLALVKPKSKLKVSHINKSVHKPAHKLDAERRLNQILDKINKSGYNSLSQEERDYLVKYSNKD
jgi:membrane associated rhomboid family serine protease